VIMELKGIEATCAILRGDIEAMKRRVTDLYYHPDMLEQGMGEVLEGPNIPNTKKANVRESLECVFHYLVNARMWLGKTMQAIQGGVSILDRANEPGMEIDGKGNVVPCNDKR